MQFLLITTGSVDLNLDILRFVNQNQNITIFTVYKFYIISSYSNGPQSDIYSSLKNIL